MGDESGKMNIFHSIKEIINDEMEHEIGKVPPKIDENHELRRDTTPSEGSVSDEEEGRTKFHNEKLDFLFKLYDQRRAAGIKPAMEYKFRPNLDIFDVDSDNPAEEVTTEEKPISLHKEAINVDEDEFKEIVELNDKPVNADIDSMQVEYDDLSSEDPDTEEIEKFEDVFLKDEKYSDSLPMTKNTPQRRLNDGLRPGKPEHNKEVYEYEDQKARENYDDSSPIDKRTSILNFKKKNPEKRHGSTRVITEDYHKKKIEVFMPMSPSELNRAQGRDPETGKNLSRNNIETLRRRQPELFETIDPDRNQEKFHPDADEKKLEEDVDTDYEVPRTPNTTPVMSKRPSGNDDPYEETEVMTHTRKRHRHHEKKHVRENAVFVNPEEDPYIPDDDLSSE